MFRCLISVFLIPFFSTAQITDTIKTSVLPEITVKSFDLGRKLKETPAAINYISSAVIERFDPASIVQAVNSTPGIRMEERSPGSYRFNIRGSSLRSPFGVRNVKIYYNDIPITDPGGHTFFNQLGFYSIASMEIIKGPGSSMYGAGTGGVMLIESASANERPSLMAEYTRGSFGHNNIYGSVTTGSENALNKIGYQHQESDGFRVHSRLKRDVFNWTGNFKFNERQSLKTTFLFGNLFYQTPGALTRVEFEADPKASRPGNAFFPGAVTANASVTQKMFLAGASYQHQINSCWQNRSVFYGMFTELRNPTIQNYGRSSEPHFGGRTIFKYNKPLSTGNLNVDLGAEIQRGFNTVSIFKNNRGTPDTLRSYDEINNRQSLVFSQLTFDINTWIITAGLSLNFLKVGFERFNTGSAGKQERVFTNELAPRIAVMKKLSPVNVYASISKGFSPPTTAELLPTGGQINLGLDAEEGWNYDIGIKGTAGEKFSYDVNAFYFSLRNNIVQRRTAGGGDFFINAGKTSQKGIETSLSYVLGSSNIISRSIAWLSHTYHDFTYKEFMQVNNDFSGKKMPAVSNHTLAAGVDASFLKGAFGSVNYYYSSSVPLNDANTEFAEPYHLLGLKAGIELFRHSKLSMKFSAGVNNLFDQVYSLGNDVNGFGGRYFNVAAGRNYFATITLGYQ